MARKTVDAAYVCGPNEALWTEPFLVTPAEDVWCDQAGDEHAARWMVEVVGYKGRDEAPYLHPVEYACDKHLPGAMERFL